MLPSRSFCLSILAAVLLDTSRELVAQGARAPGPDTVKQALDARWHQLKPQDAQERNVLFQEVHASGATSGSYVYRVSAVIRDYSLGYPRNRYYGQTCVARITGDYKMWADASGKWQVDGRMTPDLSSRQCKPNPSEGVSSIPVQGLPGTPAPSGAVAPASLQARSGGGMVQGSYECWANGQARALLNFTARSGGQYIGADGRSGSFSWDARTQRITFRGGSLDGVFPPGFYAIYHEPQGRPTVSFRNARDSEVAFCEKQ